MITEAFARCGLNAVYVDARKCIVTDAQYGKAIPQDAAIGSAAEQHVVPHLAEGRVPVMGGFIGATEAGVTTTLGRGGSDFTAALVGGGDRCGCDRNLDGRGRHYDDRPADLPGCAAGEDDQL